VVRVLQGSREAALFLSEATTIRARLSWLFATLLLAACDRLPAPDELAEPNEEVTARIRAHAPAIVRDGAGAHTMALRATVREIARQHGEKSAEHVQARSDAAMMVYEAEDASSALEFVREWLATAEAVYGHEHRETAFALGDYGRMQILGSADGYAPRADRWLRESLAVRQRVIGPLHTETVATEGFIAEHLLAGCESRKDCVAGDARLVEAERLAEHAYLAFLAQSGAEHSHTRLHRQVLGRVRVANGKSADIPDSTLPSADSRSPTH
jgi:hypothetical protein